VTYRDIKAIKKHNQEEKMICRLTQDGFQGLNVAAGIANGTKGSLTQFAASILGLLLPTGLCLGAARGSDTSEDFLAVMGGEVDKRHTDRLV
jgi:uncharacterized RmlC-like cupin family protein